MDLNQNNFLATIEQDIAEIYQRTEQHDWHDLLSFLIEKTNSNSGALILEYVDDSTPIEADLQGISDQLLPAYIGTYAKQDPWTERFTDLERGTTSFVSGDEILSLRDYKKTEFYQNWGKQAQMEHACGSYFSLKRGRAFKLGLQRNEAKGPYAIEIEYLNALRPHLERAIEIASLLKRNSLHESLLSETLTSMGFAAIWCDFKLTVLAANQLAQQLLTQQSLLTLSAEGRLMGVNFDLAGACEQSKQIRLGKTKAKVSELKRDNQGNNYELVIDTRLAGIHEEQLPGVPEHQPGYLIMLRQPTVISADAILTKFEITTAEAGVISELANGNTLAGSAETLGKSLATIKSQVKSASQKLSVNSQHELVSKVLRALL